MWFVLNENYDDGVTKGLLEQVARDMQSLYFPPAIEDVEYEDISDSIDKEPCYV